MLRCPDISSNPDQDRCRDGSQTVKGQIWNTGRGTYRSLPSLTPMGALKAPTLAGSRDQRLRAESHKSTTREQCSPVFDQSARTSEPTNARFRFRWSEPSPRSSSRSTVTRPPRRSSRARSPTGGRSSAGRAPGPTRTEPTRHGSAWSSEPDRTGAARSTAEN